MRFPELAFLPARGFLPPLSSWMKRPPILASERLRIIPACGSNKRDAIFLPCFLGRNCRAPTPIFYTYSARRSSRAIIRALCGIATNSEAASPALHQSQSSCRLRACRAKYGNVCRVNPERNGAVPLGVCVYPVRRLITCRFLLQAASLLSPAEPRQFDGIKTDMLLPHNGDI